MRFEPLALEGAWLITPEMATDERGFFARVICVEAFAAHGIRGHFVQSSISYNRRAGTHRGMHFQWPPSREDKLVRCLRGSVQDFLLDLRPDSATFLQHVGVTLDDQQRGAVYIPSGIAHGFQTLADDAEVQYHMTDDFQPDLAGGFRWSDPAFGIKMPLPVSTISQRDAEYPLFDRQAYVAEYRRRLAAAAAP